MSEVTAPTEAQVKELSVWTAMALDAMPYMASTLLALRPVNAPGLGTFAVDSRLRLYIDFDKVAAYGDLWCAEALLHECCHVINQHSDRAEEVGVADPTRYAWNCAADAEINDDLAEAGCGTIADSGVLPSHLGCDDHQTAEVYFDVAVANLPPQPDPGGSDPGGQNGQGGQGGEDGDGEFSGCGSVSGGNAAPCELDDNADLGGAASPATDTEKFRVRISTAQAILDEAAKGRGKVPAGMVAHAKTLLAPAKVPWRKVLSSSVRRAVGSRIGDYDATYSRRNRRRPAVEIAPGRRAVVAGMFSPVPTLALVRDTSGSVSEAELSLIGSEIEGIAKQMGIRGKDLRVLDVDAAVGAVRDYKGAASIENVVGRGGTDMRVGIDAAVALKPRPHAVVVLTDGGTPWPDERPPVPLVACLVGPWAAETAQHVPEWATKVVVDD